MPAAQKEHLLLLFDRPTEPLFLAKGDSKTVFEIPDGYIPDDYKTYAAHVATRFEDDAENKIQIKNISIPDLTIPLKLGKKENFSIFIRHHLDMAQKLIEIFIKPDNVEDLLAVAAFCRDRLNPYMFNYALSAALMQRKDTEDLPLPNLFQTFPGQFIESESFAKVREEGVMIRGEPIVIPKNYTSNNLNPENRVSYFREDIGINILYWQWHLKYSIYENISNDADDRRGELFYYLHRQILARYNFERFSNNLGRVKKLSNLREPISEGYFPKMDISVASRAWPSRQSNTTLSDIDRKNDHVKLLISDLELWRDEIMKSIGHMHIFNSRYKDEELTEEKGINMLGHTVRSRLGSFDLHYGNLHASGYVALGFCHDPDGEHSEPFGVTGSSATVLRDPVSYRWNAFIDDIFESYKKKLPPYEIEKLDFKNVKISSIHIVVKDGERNKLETFWQQSDIELSHGIDFVPRDSVLVRIIHLQHKPFTYHIEISNANSETVLGTVRIFLAPKRNERGMPMTFDEQKQFMIELDRFKMSLKPGYNEINRESDESCVTIPFESTFNSSKNVEPNKSNACKCGWPQHMLIPKGNYVGLTCELFVMISNYEDDEFDDSKNDCTGKSYCEVLDKRPMGFPFDRIARDGVQTLDQFMTENMRKQEVVIKFTDKIVVKTLDNY